MTRKFSELTRNFSFWRKMKIWVHVKFMLFWMRVKGQ